MSPPRNPDDKQATVDGGADAEETKIVPHTPAKRARHDDPPPATVVRSTKETVEPVLPERYQILRELGEGGMGRVYAVLDRELGREVALKVLPPESKLTPESRQRFLREARATAGLRHPGIVAVYDLDADHDLISMELVDGGSLGKRLHREGKLPPPEVRRIGCELLDALGAAHAAGIIHRDVKPENVLLQKSGAVKLVDFGIAAIVGHSHLTQPGSSPGTPVYMSPEQLRGQQVDARSDLYSTGLLLFELATGERLFRSGETEAQPYRAILRATGDRALAAVIERALQQHPERRYPDAAAFSRELSSSRPRPDRRFWRAVAAAAALTLIVSLGVALRPAPALPGAQLYALLPFEDHTGIARLDFAAAGFPRLLAAELGRVEGLVLIDAELLTTKVEDPQAPRPRWVGAARSLGASRLVRGELSGKPGSLRLRVLLEDLEGRELASIERTTPLELAPQELRAMAAELALEAGFPKPPLRDHRPQPFDLERSLELGAQAVANNRFAEARGHFETAFQLDPTAPEPLYNLALISWWTEGPEAATQGFIDTALGAGPTPTQRAFLEGLRLLVSQDYRRALEHFEKAQPAFPLDRDLLYGRFEALYHSGRAAEAIAAYRRVCARAPSFRLGLLHAFDHYAALGDAEGLAWVLERADSSPDTRADIWRPRARFSLRDYAGAVSEADRMVLLEPAGSRSARVLTLETELVKAKVVLGDLDGAAEVSARLPSQSQPFPELVEAGIGAVRGKESPEAEQRLRQRAAAERDWAGFNHWLELLLLELPRGAAERLRPLDEGLAANATPSLRSAVSPRVVEAFLAGTLRRSERLRDLATDGYPEVAAVAQALEAEGARNWTAAAEAWRRALAATADGRFLILEHFKRASVLRELGDHRGVIDSCGEVIAPRVFRWSWATAVGPCLVWTAQAEAAQGRPGEARAALERLLVLRSKASSRDPLVTQARAELAKLP